MTRHHPGEELLAGYAAGSLPEAPALLVATHLALCPACRRRVADYEALGGALVEELAPMALAPDSLARTLALIDRPAPAPQVESASVAGGPWLPQPLGGYVGGDPARLSWRWTMPGIRMTTLPVAGARVWLMRIAAGRAVPRHSHGGREMVMVLEGSYHDGAVGYGPGDVQISGPETDHRPAADPGAECLCLAVVEGGLRLGGRLGRLLSPLLGY